MQLVNLHVLLVILQVVPGSTKGCFTLDASVTMADLTRKPIKDVQVGEHVASWDGSSIVPATVLERQEFDREAEELVDIELSPSFRIRATEDHPFFSHDSPYNLSSVEPQATVRNYGLQASLLEVGTRLKGQGGDVMIVSALRRPFPGATQRSLQSVEDAVTLKVKVMTLRLDSHHWFYVEGVRVHNKGSSCFAPWTTIEMGGGSSSPRQKNLGDVKVGDYVLSWDEKSEHLVDAKVVGISRRRADASLLELSFQSPDAPEASFFQVQPVAACQSSKEAVIDSGNCSDSGLRVSNLVMTDDHPIFSYRVNGLVSMVPLVTASRYNLSVAQMQSTEQLHHYRGHNVEATVRLWHKGAQISEVLTLSLEEHHWFFAEGVRVHNKGSSGSSGGSSGGSSRAGGSSSSSGRSSSGTSVSSRSYGLYSRPIYTKSSYSSPKAYVVGAVFAFGGFSRRRYGTYYTDDSRCTVMSDADAQIACLRAIAPDSNDWGISLTVKATSTDLNNCSYTAKCCQACVACSDENCLSAILNCDQYLADVFTSCEGSESLSAGGIALVVISSIWGFCFCTSACFVIWLKCRRNALKTMARRRLKMVGNMGSLPATLQLQGTYSENGETKPCSYTWNINNDGHISGSGFDDDGHAVLNGCVSMQSGVDTSVMLNGKAMWKETRQGVTMEVSGTIVLNAQTGQVKVSATYLSSYMATKGTLDLTSTAHIPATVVGVVQPTDLHQADCGLSAVTCTGNPVIEACP